MTEQAKWRVGVEGPICYHPSCCQPTQEEIMTRNATVSMMLLLLAGLLAACAGAGGASGSTAITVEAREFQFSPSSLEVVAGQPVKLEFTNSGSVEHDFSVMEFPMETMGAAATETMPGHDMSNMSQLPDLHTAAMMGQTAKLEFTPTKPGTYEFFCTVVGHKEAGMVGTLVVKAP
jgi:uncharacterized cupredoxin-like copper-binding protein